MITVNDKFEVGEKAFSIGYRFNTNVQEPSLPLGVAYKVTWRSN